VEADVLGWLKLAVKTEINTTLQQPLGKTENLYTVQNLSLVCEISRFCHGVNEVFTLLQDYVALNGS